MGTIEILERQQNIKFEKVGNPTEAYGFKTCKTFRTFMDSHLRKAVHNKDINTEVILRGVLSAYNHFHPIKQVAVEIEGWKSESSFEIIKNMDSLTIIKYQKKFKGDEPAEVKYEVSRGQLSSLIDALNSLRNRLQDKDYLETKEIAFQYCINENIRYDPKGRFMLNEDFWTLFFAWRSMHNLFTLMLGALERLNLISYKAGQIKILNNNLSVQLILN